VTISSAIQTAQSGLKITSLKADVVATNVANSTTAGYVRRSLVVSENILGGVTAGVRSEGVARAGNEALSAERRLIGSDLSQADLLASTWNTISTRLGNTASGSGLFRIFSNFESALSNLAVSPESGSDMSAVLQAANSLVQEFNSLSDFVTSLRSDADQEIANGVDTVNSALKGIEEINAKLAKVDRTGSQAAALIDERGRLLDQISEYMPIQTVQRQSGAIDIVTTEGVYLLQSTAKLIEFTPSTVFGPEQTLASGDLSGLSVGGITITPGSSSFGAVSSGTFSALFTLRDTDLPAFSDQLDTLAGDLIARLSDDSIDPTKTPGEQGLFVDSDGSGDPGLAGRLALNAAIDPSQGGEMWRLRDGIGATSEGPSGNATILQNMLDSITSVRPINSSGIQGSYSSSELLAQFASTTGQKRVSHEAILSSASSQYTVMAEAELTETGVDVDQQMQDLLLIEQAYAANARVIEIASNMIDRLMEI
jgi:flagellar hook-associated protein 1 FlgK